MDEEEQGIEAFFADMRARVEARLVAYFDAARGETLSLSPDSIELFEQLRELTLRGGKRVRPIALACAFNAVDPARDLADTVDAGASLEVLQSFFLIHDDWMDQDEERRGGPAVHVAFREAHRESHTADCLGILAGDLASTCAWELMLSAPFPSTRRSEGLAAFIRIQKEVIFGQQLDIVGDANVSRMHQLKTGSYTVRGPLLLGALLGDASPAQILALERWGTPLGEAFQLRDDLLGTFGKPGVTGKPGDDIRHGKRTALVVEAEQTLDEKTRAPLTRVFGSYEGTDAEFQDALQMLEEQGIRASVEARLDRMVAEADDALESTPLHPAGVQKLKRLGELLAARIN